MRRARLAGGQRAGDPALPRAKDHHGVADPGPGDAMGPAHARRERLIQGRQLRRYLGGDLVQRDLGVEVHEFRHPAPQGGRNSGRDETANGNLRARTAGAAVARIAALARAAMTTAASRLDRDSIAGLEAPTPGGLGADFFDDADRFMPG